ncbi:MAG: hypothetical protein AAFS04_18710 [Cyanobacteria bacterium J06631_9]
MNQRLVESVAQIILTMNDDERRLLERKLQGGGLQRLSEAEADKTARIAELAQDICDFEEMYGTPLSELPAERWAVAETTADRPVTGENRASDERSLINILGEWPDLDQTTDEHPERLSSFVQLSAQDDEAPSYAVYDAFLQNG